MTDRLPARGDARLTLSLEGRAARDLAERLLGPQEDVERAFARLAPLAGRTGRIAHDWDPASGRLTVAA